MPRSTGRRVNKKQKKKKYKKATIPKQYANNVGYKYSERNSRKNVILIGVKMK